MTVNVLLSVHLQAGVKTLTPTDCKTLHINLLVTKLTRQSDINAAILSQSQKRHCGIFWTLLMMEQENECLEQVSHIGNISSKLAF